MNFLTGNPATERRIPVLNRFTLLSLALIVAVSATFFAGLQVSADGERGFSGTVLRVDDTSMRVATKHGLRTLVIDADTSIKRGKQKVSLQEIRRGSRIAAKVESLGSGSYLATRIAVHNKKGEKKVKHLTGVVIDRNEDGFRIVTRKGKSFEISFMREEVEEPGIAGGESEPVDTGEPGDGEANSSGGDDDTDVGDVVTTIVETDSDTGDLVARQVEQVRTIVSRLETSLSTELDDARAAVLREIIDESARQHLDTLNQTLDAVEDEAREKIAAALDRFRTDYAEVAQRVGNAAPEETFEGVIASTGADSITVASSIGSGSRSFTVSGSTSITVDGIADASIIDLEPGAAVSVRFSPPAEGEAGDPVALVVEAIPPALPPEVTEAIEDLSDEVISGQIVVVEAPSADGSAVIIIEESGSGNTVGVEVTGETEVTLDGQTVATDDLAQDQQVEVAVTGDGVTAESILASSTSPSPSESSLAGVVIAVDATQNLIQVRPAAGDVLRLSLSPSAVVTLDGAVSALGNLNGEDLVLDSSRYIPDELLITRLAVSRPVQPSEEPGPESPVPGAATPTPEPQPEGTGESSTEGSTFSMTGVLKSFDSSKYVFDGMELPRTTGYELPESISEGAAVILRFQVQEDGTALLTAIEPR